MFLDNTMHQHLFSPLAIAPMIDWTYSHFRVLMRMMLPKALLYTEMLSPQAILNHPERYLAFSSCETPLALQLGGRDGASLVEAARLAEQYGYQEINLNLGCPSDRVQSGQFGACLMKEPYVVAAAIKALKSAIALPITAKVRIGVDEEDSYPYFESFALMLVESGVDKIIVHARKAWLKGLSPKQNRTIPPLHYPYVYELKSKLPDLPIVINGNINTVEAMLSHLQKVDGVMIGRLACDNPYLLCEMYHALYPDDYIIPARLEILTSYGEYANNQFEKGAHWGLVVKPILNLAHGLPHAKRWKESLLEMARTRQSTIWEQAVALFPS